MAQVDYTNEIIKAASSNLKDCADLDQEQLSNIIRSSETQILGAIALNTAVIADYLKMMIELELDKLKEVKI